MAHDLTRLEVTSLPVALAGLHRATTPGARRQVRFASDVDAARRADIATGAGFTVVRGARTAVTTLERFWSLPDTVGPGMKLLIIGLNPSPAAADAGVGFARPGNRFWPAALTSGLATVDRDPDDALRSHHVGMTDVVKRTTRRADELTAAEYRSGIDRIDRLATWLEPAAVCFVGLAGWRSTIDRHAIVGWQERSIGGSPTYLMPSTSGLNASSRLEDFVEHLQRVKRGR